MSVDLYKALEISGIGIAGVFLFMTVFYFVIMGLDKFFPNKQEMEKISEVSQEEYEPVEFNDDEFE
ncbi:MAG: OadG-related small transporter subunit [Paludibacteraceae bacterium]